MTHRLWSPALILLSACSASIHQFEVRPRNYCPGTQSLVSWDFTGSGTLNAAPPLGGEIDRTVIPKDSLRLPPGGPLRVFTLTVTRFPFSHKIGEKDVLPLNGATDQWVGAVTTAHGADSLIAIDSIPVREWDPRARIDSITNNTGRPIVVRHAGRVDTLAAGTASAELGGATMDGLWEFRAALLDGEGLHDPTHPVLRILSISVHLVCGGE